MPQTLRSKRRVASRVSDTCSCPNPMNLRFKVLVQKNGGMYNVYMEVSPSDTIGDIKKRLHTERNLQLPESQTITYYGKTLVNRLTLSDYGIQLPEPLEPLAPRVWMQNTAFGEPIRWDMKLKFRVHWRSNELDVRRRTSRHWRSNESDVRRRTWRQFDIHMIVYPSETIGHVKWKLHIQEELDVPEFQVMFYLGKTLKDTLTLSDYGLQLPEPVLLRTLCIRIDRNPRPTKRRRMRPWWAR